MLSLDGEVIAWSYSQTNAPSRYSWQSLILLPFYRLGGNNGRRLCIFLNFFFRGVPILYKENLERILSATLKYKHQRKSVRYVWVCACSWVTYKHDWKHNNLRCWWFSTVHPDVCVLSVSEMETKEHFFCHFKGYSPWDFDRHWKFLADRMILIFGHLKFMLKRLGYIQKMCFWFP